MFLNMTEPELELRGPPPSPPPAGLKPSAAASCCCYHHHRHHSTLSKPNPSPSPHCCHYRHPVTHLLLVINPRKRDSNCGCRGGKQYFCCYDEKTVE
ncbi:hypothetical protein Hdeb2414_s0001g00012631 [Helianthus debilis subsp. tardiflorus]